MTRRAVRASLAAVGLLIVALACGEVPTLPGGIAYISGVLVPSPSVAFGDTLRDSLGRAAPLRVIALGRGTADTIRTAVVRYLFTSLGSGAFIGGDGYLVAPESLQTLRLVAQVNEAGGSTGLQLQTTEISIDVVPLADAITYTIAPDTADTTRVRFPNIVPLSVTVTGVGPKNVRGTVAGIRVHYRIAGVFPDSPAARGLYHLSADQGAVLRPDSTIALDTTSSVGVASRSLTGLAATPVESTPDSVVVLADALSQRGVPLRGSPVRFVVKVRR